MPAHDMNTKLANLSAEAVNAAIGAAFRKARERAGLTRPELIERLPFDAVEATILNWELAKRAISPFRLFQAAPVLGTTVPDIMKDALEHMAEYPDAAMKFDLHPNCMDARLYAGIVDSANSLRAELDKLVGKLTQS